MFPVEKTSIRTDSRISKKNDNWREKESADRAHLSRQNEKEENEHAGSKRKNKYLKYFNQSGKTDWKQKSEGCQRDKDFKIKSYRKRHKRKGKKAYR